MSDRYTWAVDAKRTRTGRSGDRSRWLLGRAAAPESATTPAPAGDAAPAPRPVAAPPVSADGLWQPLGPTTSVRGVVDSDVRVTGRVNGLAVSPDGQRVYVVSGLGGVWYSGNAGATWEPVGAWRTTTDRSTLAPSSHSLAGGAIHVRFVNDITDDEVWVGTGEPVPPWARDSGVVGGYGGVGVLHKVGPVQAARAAPLADPWDPAQAVARPPAPPAPAYAGLRGQGVFRIAANPADNRHLIAATTAGLHVHSSAAAAGTDPWSLMVVPVWEALAGGLSATAYVTDIAWLPATGAHAARFWSCLVDPVSGGTGLWCSTGGAAFVPIPLPGLNASTSRLSIAAHANHPDVLYVLGTGPSLWRIDGTTAPPTAQQVGGVPAQLFGQAAPPQDQSFYDCAAAIDPASSANVIVGGAAVASPVDAALVGAATPSWAAALYLLTVAPSGAPAPAPPFTSTYVGGEASDPTWIGSEVHADVHTVVWQTVGAAAHVWVGCDGGAFRSTRGGALGTFVARATGMVVTEPGFLATHPTSPGVLLAGMQDNGPQLQVGAGVWRQVTRFGDGGGVAFDPGAPGRFVAQWTQSTWNDDTNSGITPTFRLTSALGSAFATENANSSFYSNAAVIRTTGATPQTRLAVGTDRIWYTTSWGRSRWDGAVFRRNWVTLPSATDPRAGDASTPAALATDQLAIGGVPWGSTAVRTGIRALRWRDTTRLLAVTRGSVHQVTDPGGAGAWGAAVVATRLPVPGAGVPAVVPAPAAAAGLPGFGEYNDVGVHDPGVGSFYLATSHPLDPLWWWDGVATCHPTGLGTLPAGTRAPAYAVVVDPADTAAVYVGTTIGVWRGRFTPGVGAAPPTWVWQHFSTGLPEAAAQDLSIGVYPRPGGQPDLRLLRVATQARGTFEVDLGAPATSQTYLRVHPHDTRRILPSPTDNPLFAAGSPRRSWSLDWGLERNRDHRTGGGLPRAHPDGTPVASFLWHASPDLVLRPTPVSVAPGAVAAPADLPWTGQPSDRFALWSVQTAIRALDPAVFPDAPHVVPDGRWTPWWVRRLRAVRTVMGLPNPGPVTRGRVDAALWNDARVQAAMWAVPWADGGPTEADLLERVVGMATPRTGGPSAGAVRSAAAAATRRRWQVDVCVHHRGLTAAAAADTAVVLLRTVLPGTAGAWATVAAPAIAGLAAALDALPADTSGGAAPNALPGYAPPAEWAFVDPARPARRPASAVAAGAPSVVTFDTDFSADPVNTDVLVLALVHHRTEPVTLAAGPMRDAVLGSSHAGARSIRVRA